MYPNRLKMKILLNLLPLTAVVTLCGCGSVRDVTSKADGRTDFVAGETYTLKKPVFLFKYDKESGRETPRLAPLGFAGTPENPEEFQRRAHGHPNVVGLLVPETRVRIIRFV